MLLDNAVTGQSTSYSQLTLQCYAMQKSFPNSRQEAACMGSIVPDGLTDIIQNMLPT